MHTPACLPLNAARNLYPKLYQRFPEILRKLGASGLMATPTEADVTGPAAADIDTYLQAATLSGADRVRLFRLAWDTCLSAFAGRQALYEYYFFGDPVRMAGAYVANYDKSPYADRVRAFLSIGYDHLPRLSIGYDHYRVRFARNIPMELIESHPDGLKTTGEW